MLINITLFIAAAGVISLLISGAAEEDNYNK